ncbi:cytidine/deoxycytidylate deaminase family protein [Mangrovicoccus ximenensis]|uniref:hypothetical protein n=1 Tax=Mangrovicoccus ximenensis TaxID=1911570 RepID=UPI000D37ADF6|nr:hypothetical protein [Mangrovicoccus ximenensis]
MAQHDTLTSACGAVSKRGPNQIGLVLGIGGAIYFDFLSAPSLSAAGISNFCQGDAGKLDGASAHAEMVMIASWKACMQAYWQRRQKPPKSCEIFLTSSPCRSIDAAPSVAMTVHGETYPDSCEQKLIAFFKKNNSVTWRIYYWEAFGTVNPFLPLKASFDAIGVEILKAQSSYQKADKGGGKAPYSYSELQKIRSVLPQM